MNRIDLMTYYHEELLEPARLMEVANRVAKGLKAEHKKYPFEALAVRGVSGVGMGSVVSALSGIPLIVVRKPGENSHGRSVEGSPGRKVTRYAVLDDFVSTGATVRAIEAELRPAELLAVFTYKFGFDRDPQPWPIILL